MPGLLGKKIGMTSVFGADGKNIPCTVIEAGPCVVTQLKTVEKDGYKAAQVGFMHKSEKHTWRTGSGSNNHSSRPLRGGHVRGRYRNQQGPRFPGCR